MSAPKIISDYGQVQTQVEPDSLVYTLEQPSLSSPSASSYQTAFDSANKNFTSVNDSSFKPITGQATASLAQPILQQVQVPVAVPTFDFLKAGIFSLIAFFAYKTFFKRGRK